MLLIRVAVAALLASIPASGSAQAVFGGEMQPRIVEGAASAPAGTFYVGGYAAPGNTTRHIVNFYSRRDPADVSEEGVPYVSIPLARRVLERDGVQGEVQWADGRDCPGLYGVMREFTRLQPPLFSTPRFHSEPAGAGAVGGVGPGLHAPTVAVWGYARMADGAPTSMMLTGDGGILKTWVVFAERELAGCWSD